MNNAARMGIVQGGVGTLGGKKIRPQQAGKPISASHINQIIGAVNNLNHPAPGLKQIVRPAIVRGDNQAFFRFRQSNGTFPTSNFDPFLILGYIFTFSEVHCNFGGGTFSVVLKYSDGSAITNSPTLTNTTTYPYTLSSPMVLEPEDEVELVVNSASNVSEFEMIFVGTK